MKEPGQVRYVTIPLCEEASVPIRAYMKGELAALYGVSHKTLRKWMHAFLPELELLGYTQDQKRLTKRQVELVFARVGEP